MLKTAVTATAAETMAVAANCTLALEVREFISTLKDDFGPTLTDSKKLQSLRRDKFIV